MSCRRFAIFKVDQQLKAQEMSVDQQENFRWAGGQPLTCFKPQDGSRWFNLSQFKSMICNDLQ
jgi:hypothetical protein